MQVCHLTTVHPAQDSRIFYRMCRGLASAEIPVSLIAPEDFAAEPYLRPSVWNRRIGNAPRAWRVRLALKAALDEDADLYHFHDPELIPLALTLKMRKPAKAVVYDVHEDYPSMMRDKYWLPKWLRPTASAGARVANEVAGKFLDGIVAADPGVEADFRKWGPDKTTVYYNFPILALFNPFMHGPARAAADLVYLGGMSERSGIFVLFDALQILMRQGIEPTVRLAGYTDGEQGLDAIREAIQRKGLVRQIEFDGRIPHAQVPQWISGGAIGLVLLQAVPKFMKNIPSKLFEYWACGLPVVASRLPPIERFVVDGENGFLFAPGDARALAEKIHYLLIHPEARDRLGKAGQWAVRIKWNNENQVDGLIDFYRRVCRRIPPATLRRDCRRSVAPAKPVSVTELPSDSTARSEH